MIERISTKDIERLVVLRNKVLGGFLTELGTPFLREYYTAAMKVSDVVILGAKKKNQLIGFVTVVFETKWLHIKFLYSNLFGLIFSIMSNIITRPRHIIKIIRTFEYTGFDKNTAEILSIAVDSTFQGQGWGKKLFFAAVAEFKKKGISTFLISTYAKDSGPNAFYKKLGCKLEKTFFFRSEKMNYYRYTIV